MTANSMQQKKNKKKSRDFIQFTLPRKKQGRKQRGIYLRGMYIALRH